MKKNLIVLLGLCALNANAFNLDDFKDKIRGPMAKMLGGETTNKILGKEEVVQGKIQLPKIPKVELNAINEKFYDKKGIIYSQGEKYNKLSTEEKRSFRVSFLRQIYTAARNSEVRDEDLAKSLNVLEQGGNREGVYRSITLDPTYARLEQYNEKPSDALVNFVEYFPPKYLKKKYKKESIKKLNLWSLKRLLAEKSLELLDVLANKPDDLYRWYAVFSAEVAKDYPSLWQSKTRKNTFDEFHYKWAQTVPFQHIKSEVVIKIHKLMNHLNSLN